MFQEASGDVVLCIDCHVFIAPGALQRLIAHCDANPRSKDLLQGPLIHDDLINIATHMKPEWRAGMYGIWSKTVAGADIEGPPFAITMQGLGLFACRREAWPGFNPLFRGFGGEEGYIQGADVWLKVCDPTAPIQSHAYPWTWPFVDIFIYSSDPAPAGGAWPTLQYPRNMVLPGRLTQFEGVRCWEPEQPPALLDLQYEGWRHRETSSGWNHRWERRPKAVSIRSILTDARGRKVAAHPATYQNPLAHGILLPLLRAWIDLCRQHDIDYSIYWGTLLGQVRSQRIIPHDQDVDVVVGKSGMEAVYALPGRVAACVFNDELKSQPAWCEHEIRLVVRRDLISADGERYDHRGLRVSTQVDSCAFNGPLARLIIRLPKAADGREYWHLDVDLFTHISRFNPYPARDEVDELPECEERPLENLLVSCLKDPLPYLTRYYGTDYLTPDHVYRDGDWVARG